MKHQGEIGLNPNENVLSLMNFVLNSFHVYRFVDYTFATPWESLVGDIEQIVKGFLGKSPDSSMKTTLSDDKASSALSPQRPLSSSSSTLSALSQPHILTYDDYKFTIALEEAQESTFISHWFGVSTPYILICHHGEWRSDTDPSSRHSFFSAAITALSNLKTSFPILFVPAIRMNLDRACDALGYRIYRLPTYPMLPYAILTHFKSTKEVYYDHLTSYKHALFYLDAAYEEFLRLLSKYQTNSSTTQAEKLTSVEVIEQYSCSSTSLKFMAIYQYNEKSFLPRQQSWLVNSFKYQTHIFRQALRYRSLPDLDKGDVHALEEYVLAAPDSRMTSFALDSVKALNVSLAYRGSRHDFRVDNPNYTTMHPSKQRASAWSVNASFTSYASSVRPLTNTQDQLIRYGHDTSLTLRYLLANFIISRSTISSASITNLFNLEIKAKDLINKDRARALSASLSTSTKDLVELFMERIIKQYKAYLHPSSSAASGSRMRDASICSKYMKTLFSTADENRSSLDDLSGWRNGSLSGSHPNLSITSVESSSDLLSSKMHSSSSSEISSAETAADDGMTLSWTAILAILASNFSDGLWSISLLWEEVLRQLRLHWESDLPLSHVTLQSIRQQQSQQQQAAQTLDSYHEVLKSAPRAMLFKQSLWEDGIISMGQVSGYRDLSLPDMHVSLFNQKLAMLQFCLASKQQSHLISYKAKGLEVNLQRRLPLTEDLVQQYHRLCQKIANSRARQLSSDLPYSSSRPSTPSTSVNSSPMLSTDRHDDELSLQQQVFHYQILAPSLVSDIRAFKAAYPEHNFDSFYSFCSATDNGSEDEISTTVRDFMQEAWTICSEGLPAAEQKPLLRVETEAEKCLSYFESLSTSKLMLELLLSSLPAVYSMIAYELSSAIVDLMPSCSNDDELSNICDSLLEDLASIARDIPLAIHELRFDAVVNQDTFLSSSSRHRSVSSGSITPPPAGAMNGWTDEESISGGVGMSAEAAGIILVDAIERKVARLEDFLLQYRALIILLNTSAVDTQGRPSSIPVDALDVKRLALRLWKHGQATARSPAEAQILFMLAKNSVTPGSLASDRASAHGREISPVKKSLILQQRLFLEEDNTSSDSLAVPDLSHRFVVDIAEDNVRISSTMIQLDG
jgi:hypothetical protein